MSTISIFGGTGFAGSRIAREAVARGHRVTSYSRHAPATPIDGVTYRTGSLADQQAVAAAATDADDLVIATPSADVEGRPLVGYLPAVIDAVNAGGARLSFVGGAGSLLLPDGTRLVDSPDFHDDWKPGALAHCDVLEALRAAPEPLRWFYVSPPAMFGAWTNLPPTGSYRLGTDELISDAHGASSISGEDFATAYVDEIERSAHPRQRFTVGR